MLHKLEVVSHKRDEVIEITHLIQEIIKKENFKTGLVCIYIPHTTAGVFINENADPSVKKDILYSLDRLIPFIDRNYSHIEGNSASHVKASLVGTSQIVIVEKGKILLGTWQGIYFAEFDGPRKREIWVKIMV